MNGAAGSPSGSPNGSPTFAQQRLICFALLMGVGAFALVVAFLLQQNGGAGLSPEIDPLLGTMVLVVGPSMAVAALVARSVLGRKAEAEPAATRASARFRAVLVPMAMLEGGALLGITVWMLSGAAVPNLVVALVLLALMIALVPLRDPDEGLR